MVLKQALGLDAAEVASPVVTDFTSLVLLPDRSFFVFLAAFTCTPPVGVGVGVGVGVTVGDGDAVGEALGEVVGVGTGVGPSAVTVLLGSEAGPVPYWFKAAAVKL